MEKLDYLDSDQVIRCVMKEIDWWEKERSLVEYFQKYETRDEKEEVPGLSQEVVQAAFEYVQMAVKEFESKNFDSETWGKVLESCSIWLIVAQQVREYCLAMGNLGCDKKRERKVEIRDTDDEPIPSNLLPNNPFLEPLPEEEEGCVRCECCENTSPSSFLSCFACGHPFKWDHL
jgi:hypothetical protein